MYQALLRQVPEAERTVALDYLTAYFDFFIGSAAGPTPFANARAMVAKHKEHPIEHFRLMFLKIREQLDEIDVGRREALKVQGQVQPPIDAEQDEAADEEQQRQARLRTKAKTPIIHDISIDARSGELTIESDNIDAITVKYYLIDAEILFSRSPFVQDNADQFSYVKPFLQLVR